MNDRIRERLLKDASETLVDLITNDYENELGKIDYIGKVVDNNDPDKLGRCRIRVFGIFGNEVLDKDLPWALPEFSFLGSKVGNFIVPPIDAIVRVYFDCGEIYLPIYTTKVVDTNNIPTRRMKNYPDNLVMFETDKGDYLEIDRNTSLTTYHHESGTEIKIVSNGSVIIDCKGEVFSIEGAKNCSIKGTETTSLGGNSPALYFTLSAGVPSDAEGRPIQGIGVSRSVTVGT